MFIVPIGGCKDQYRFVVGDPLYDTANCWVCPGASDRVPGVIVREVLVPAMA